MGLDSPNPISPEAQAEPVSGRKATTASMQNLLAQYFDTQNAEAPQPANYDAPAGHALSSSNSETRPRRLEDAVAASFARLEAAFVEVKSVEAAPPPPELKVVPTADDVWPEAARHLVASLTSERDDLREEIVRLRLQLAAAQDQADNDVLTPTLNRRAFLREVQRAMADCKRYGEEACLIYLDMDSFKTINDTYGHAAGDRALIYVAEALKASVREGDAVGRIGGDEFSILLRHSGLGPSRIKAMKLEAELMMGTFEHDGLHLKTGGSFGVRAFSGQASAEAWLSEADAAMFLVKKASR